ncbi:MAG: homoserine kinase [Rhizobiales bacterium]|nr:homoserine kinase [Hyphomicrobiales bacterium]
MAVYTDVTDDELTAFLARYDVGALTAFRGIAEGVENSNYLVDTDRTRLILTLYEKRVARADLPFFLSLLQHLASKGLPCPEPYRDRAGRTEGELAGRPAALFSFLQGVWPRRPTAHHCGELGRALARLHLAGADFPMCRENALSHAGWTRLAADIGTAGEEVSAGITDIVAAELTALARAWPTGLPRGIIHADLFPDNVFFHDGAITGLIDFYFACNDLYAYDVAICLNSWCFENDREFNVTKAAALLKGYHSVRPLGSDEIVALPVLARGAALRFLMTRLYDWLNTPPDAFVRPHDPLAYLNRLRFHQRIADTAAYGIGI